MALPRRRVRDDELPELPPLDGDDAPADLDVGDDAPPDEGPASLDDAAADELTLADVDEPVDVGDDAGAPVDVGDDADEVSDGGEAWRGDAEEGRGEADDVDALDELPPDDGGAEGVDGDAADDLGELPPMDDDAADEGPVEGEAIALSHAPPPEPGVEARVLAVMASGAAPGVCVGVDHVFAAGDRLLAWPTALLDDPEAAPLALDAPGDEVLCAVSEDAARTLTVADHDGALWRRARARDPWRRLRWTDDDREGPVSLDAGPAALWALSARGSLRREAAGHFGDALAEERVRAVSADAGGAAAAVSGRRRDGVRVTDDGATWAARPTPEALDADAVARAGEVLAVAGAGGGFVSADGGARWAAWPLLAGATALCVGEADDGDARVFAAVLDGDRALVVAARVAGDGGAESPATLCDVAALLPRGGADDDEPPRVERLVAVDRAGRRLLAAVSTGAVLLVTRRA